MNILTFILVCVSSLVGLIIIIAFIRRRAEENWFDDDDEEDYEDDYQEERLSFLSDSRSNRGSPSQSAGPSGGPPRNTPPADRNRPSGGPPKQRPNVPQQSSLISHPAISTRDRSQSDTSKSKKVKSVTKTGKKVRKANLEVDLDIFEGVEDSHRDSAIDWVVESLSEGASEREMLMQLQGNGWNAPQSRAIINLGKNR